MSSIMLDGSQIRSVYDIDAVRDAIDNISDQVGWAALHRYATENPLSSEGRKVRTQIMEQMHIASAWSGGHEFPESVHQIFARCAYLDELAINDPMKGSYMRAAPFLAALYLRSTFPVWDCLEGKISLANTSLQSNGDELLIALGEPEQKKPRLLTDEEIEEAKKKAPRAADGRHEHNDCIRIAYEWLDAQKKTKNPTTKLRQFKHIIEAWGERYVSTDDVQVAAWMHPEIKGKYPRFNIGKQLTLPSKDRLKNIEEAGKHPSYSKRYQDVYDKEEAST